MKLKIKKEYIDYSVSKNRKRIYFIEMNDEQKAFWFSNGFDYIFDVEKPKKVEPIKELPIEEKIIDKLDDTDK
jgi:hypothetical protein